MLLVKLTRLSLLVCPPQLMTQAMELLYPKIESDEFDHHHELAELILLGLQCSGVGLDCDLLSPW